MKAPCILERRFAVRTLALFVFAASAVISGCATDGSTLGAGTSITASDKTRMTKSGFLSDYASLQVAPWCDGIER